MLQSAPLQKPTDPAGVQPSHLIKSSPQFGGFVDINLAGLLRVRLAELLTRAQALQAALEDASFAGEVRGTVEAKIASEEKLVRMQQFGVRIAAEINGLALPVHLEAVGTQRQRVQRRAVIDNGTEILVLAVRSNDPP